MIGASLHAESFRRVLRERSGLVIDAGKDYLLQTRLEPLARDAGLPDVPALLAALARDPNGALCARAVDALATHESSFFRDGWPFEVFRDTLLPQIAAARAPGAAIRIWSAACSSGQEPYSLAMAALEAAPRLGGRTVEILATDMAEPILRKAREGRYSDFEARRGLTAERLSRWMREEGAAWRVAPEVMSRVEFRAHNLLERPPAGARFDLIFCRNVLIYFDTDGKRRALERLADALAPDGALMLGGSEALVGMETGAFVPAPGLRGVCRLREAEPARRFA